MNRYLRFLVSLFALIIGIHCVACKPQTNVNKSARWQGRYIIEVKELLRIGTDNYQDDIYTFSTINDIQIDSDKNIYVLDRKEVKMKIFSSLGKHINTIAFKKGQGPGDVGKPLMFDIGADNNLFISDMENHCVNIFSNTGKYLDIIPIDFLPGQIKVHGNSIFISTLLCAREDKNIHEYEYPGKKKILSFCELDSNNRLYKEVGFDGSFCFDSNGGLIYATALPYEIRRYSKNGNILDRYSRKLKKNVELKKNEVGLLDSNMDNAGICSFSDGKILNYIRDREAEPMEGYFDVFSKTGEWLMTIPVNEYFDNWNGRIVRMDKDNCIYLDFWTPFPHVRKYALNIVKK